MGVDAKLTLARGATARSVMTVMAKLAGATSRRVEGRGGSFYLDIEGAQVRATTVSTCASLNFPSPALPWPRLDDVLYHHEWWVDGRGEPGCTGLTLSASAPCIALLIATGRFFGGELDVNDCDDTLVDFEWPARPVPPLPMSRADFRQLQLDIEALQPITSADIEAAEPLATYKGVR